MVIVTQGWKQTFRKQLRYSDLMGISPSAPWHQVIFHGLFVQMSALQSFEREKKEEETS